MQLELEWRKGSRNRFFKTNSFSIYGGVTFTIQLLTCQMCIYIGTILVTMLLTDKKIQHRHHHHDIIIIIIIMTFLRYVTDKAKKK